MLVEKSERPIMAGLIVKNSEFYIELAKFVQAYTTIINHPNLFLREIGEPNVAVGEKLNWKQMSTILRKCDFGFANQPTDMDLLVFYNYALEIGSVDSLEKKVASVEQVSDAQKSYYNFVDDAKTKAEEKYFKAHQTRKVNQTEMAFINAKLSKINVLKYLALSFMILSVIVFTFGVVSFIFENDISKSLSSIFNFENGDVLALSIVIVFSVALFLLFDKVYVKQSKKYQKLYNASEAIFSTGIDSVRQERILRRKLVLFENQLKIVQAEIASENKSFDVEENIKNLIKSNKYYKDLYAPEAKQQKVSSIDQSEFEPVVLSKTSQEETEDLEKGVILQEGQFDLEAYNKEFEQGRNANQNKQQNLEEKGVDKESEMKQKDNNKEIDENSKQVKEEIQRQQQIINENQKLQQEAELIDSIDYIKSILGIEDENEYEKN